MDKAQRFCFYCAKKMWQMVAITIVSIAVLISILKYSLPYADSYRADIQRLIKEQYGAQVYISQISAGWEKTGPAIVLKKLAFRPTEAAPLDIAINEIKLKIDFWDSLMSRSLKSNYFVLDGVIVKLDTDELLSRTGNTQSAPINDALSKLFLGQLQQFSVKNSHLILASGENRQNIKIKELEWRNDVSRHQGVGEFYLQGFSENTLSFVLDLYGDEKEETFGELYVNASEIDVSPWLSSFVTNGYRVDKSSVNFESWARINKGVIQRVQFELGDNQLAWSDSFQQQQLEFGQGQVEWMPLDTGWHIISQQLMFKTARTAWPSLDLQIVKNGKQIELFTNTVELEKVLPVAQLFVNSESLDKQLSEFQPEGVLTNVQLSLEDNHWKGQAELSDLGWNNVNDIPGAQDLSGNLLASNESISLNLSGERNFLLTGQLFRKAISYDDLNLELSAFKLDDVWQISAPVVELIGQDIDLYAGFNLALKPGSPELSLYGELSLPDVVNAKNFYPLGYMPQSTIDYLNRSLKGGEIKQAQILWQGGLNKFPYRNNNGIFVAKAQLDNTQFEFDSAWPQISDLALSLKFENENMLITSESGMLQGIQLGDGVSVEIKDLFQADVLDIDIHTTANADNVVSLMQIGGLKNSVGKALETIYPTGQLKADVYLGIGLKEKSVEAIGDIAFSGNEVELLTPRVTLSDVTGHLKFDSDVLTATELSASWLGLPLTLALDSQQNELDYDINIKVAHEGDVSKIDKALALNFEKHLSGDIDLSGELALKIKKEGFEYTSNLSANLVDVESILPAPYNKLKNEKGQLTAVIKGDKLSNLVTANVDDQLFFNGIIPNHSGVFSRAHLILGQQDLGLSGQGFHISVDLPHVDMFPWVALVKQITKGTDAKSGPSAIGAPIQIAGKTKELSLLGQTLTNVRFDTQQLDQLWRLSLNASETALQADFFKDWDALGINVNVDYLKLKSFADADEQENAFTPLELLQSVPPIRFECADCSWKEYDLGRVKVALKPDGNTVKIDDFMMVKGKNSLAANGLWQADETTSSTQFDARIMSNDFGDLLSEYDLTSTIKDSDADIKMSLDWQGAPHQLKLANLNGAIDWKLGEGHLDEVSDGGARLLSLLSLDSLFRKLRLDFRDVFSKGLFYNSFNGKMAIENGIASTNNTEIDGIAAEIKITGSTNLVEKTLDYQFGFKPKVTSSLPILVAFMVNPISGLATLALDKVIESANVVSEIELSLTGTIEKPILTEVKRTNRDVKLPQTAVKKPPVDEGEAIVESPPLTIKQ